MISKVVMASTLISALTLSACGSSSEPSANKPPASTIPGAKQVGQASQSPDEEGALISASKSAPVDPRQLDKDIPASPVPVVSADQLSAALKQLDDTEQGLEAFGLKFKIEKTAKGRGINWDYDEMDRKEDEGVKIFDALGPLENYLKVAYKFLDQYDRKFIVNGKEDTSIRLMNDKMPTLASKIQVVEKTVADIKENLAAAAKKPVKQKQSRRSTRTQVA